MFEMTLRVMYANADRWNTSILPQETFIDVINSIEVWFTIYDMVGVTVELWVHTDAGHEVYHTVQ